MYARKAVAVKDGSGACAPVLDYTTTHSGISLNIRRSVADGAGVGRESEGRGDMATTRHRSWAEPWKVKMVEHLKMTTREEREKEEAKDVRHSSR